MSKLTIAKMNQRRALADAALQGFTEMSRQTYSYAYSTGFLQSLVAGLLEDSVDQAKFDSVIKLLQSETASLFVVNGKLSKGE